MVNHAKEPIRAAKTNEPVFFRVASRLSAWDRLILFVDQITLFVDQMTGDEIASPQLGLCIRWSSQIAFVLVDMVFLSS